MLGIGELTGELGIRLIALTYPMIHFRRGTVRHEGQRGHIDAYSS